jgi:hypothetical protein
LDFPFGKRLQQNNDSDANGAGRVRRSFALAREQCESLFCCIDFQNLFEGHGRSWDPWTSYFSDFPFRNRVQQNNDSHVNGAERVIGYLIMAREQCESLFCCSDFQIRFGGDGRSLDLWTLRFLVFRFGNRVQQNNDSYHYVARKLG